MELYFVCVLARCLPRRWVKVCMHVCVYLAQGGEDPETLLRQSFI